MAMATSAPRPNRATKIAPTMTPVEEEDDEEDESEAESEEVVVVVEYLEQIH